MASQTADWSFKLRSYLGAVDQRYQEELTKTEASSTPRLNATLGSEESALSMQMYYILVMTKTLYRCRSAGVNEGFRGWRQFVRGREPRFIGLPRNVLSCRRKDDMPIQLPADEELTHGSQSTETVIDDIMTDVNVLKMEDGRAA